MTTIPHGSMASSRLAIYARAIKHAARSRVNKLREGRSGQAALDSLIGRFLHDMAQRDDVRLALEMGTWNGCGSTYCLAMGLSKSGGKLITVEPNRAMYESAVQFYRRKKLPVELIHGSSIAPAQFPPLSDFDKISGEIPNRAQWPQWYQQDVEAARQSRHPGVLDELIARHGAFDLVYLDGGEFTSYAEFLKVRDLTRYIVLDDCNPALVVKNVWSREALLSSPDWKILVDLPDDRNGWCAFEKIMS